MFQRRVDGSVDFWLGWDEYKNGFGDLSHEHWLGLEQIYAITNNGKTYELRMDLNDGFDDEYALYASFSISDEAGDYTLDLGAYAGGVGKLNDDKHYSFI